MTAEDEKLAQNLLYTAKINSCRFDDDHPLVGELRQAASAISRLSTEVQELRAALTKAGKVLAQPEVYSVWPVAALRMEIDAALTPSPGAEARQP